VRRRIAATAVLAVGLALGTAGCTFLAPTATLIKYNPSDGISANVGAIQLRNVFVIAPKGTDANLVGVMINTSKDPHEVELEYTTHVSGKSVVTETVVDMAAGEVISFGNPGVKQLVFRKANVPAGALLKVFVQYGSVSGKNLQLPVLTGTQSYYKGLAPSPLPKATPTSTATPTPTPTPTN
jgi:hypothetical protein